jgi:hypothetical protein
MSVSAQTEKSNTVSDPRVEIVPPKGESIDKLSLELSRRRTGISFQRTRMIADRMLMSVMRPLCFCSDY